MKTCPVCNAAAFDDALICFGCMHRFDEDEIEVEESDITAPIDTSLAMPPEFCIKFTPIRTPTGTLTWNCAVEV